MYYSIEKILRAAFQSVAFVIMARYLSPETFGNISFATSIFAMISTVSVFGLDQIVIRSAARLSSKSFNIALRAIIVSLVIGLGLGLLLALIAYLMKASFERESLLLLSAAVPLAFSSIAHSYLLAIRHDKWLSLSLSFESLLFSSARILLCLLKVDPYFFIVLSLVEFALIAFTSLFYFFASSHFSPDLRLSFRPCKVLFLSGAPLAASTVTVFLYMRVDQFMLRALESAEALGVYLLALKITEMTSFLIGTVFRSQSTLLHKIFCSSKEGFYDVVERTMSLVLAASVVFSFIMMYFGDDIFTVFFGVPYSDAGGILSLLFLTIPAIVVGQFSMLISVSHGSFSSPFLRTALGFLINIIGNFYLIPIYGAFGAAISTVVAFWTSAIVSLSLAKEDRDLFFAAVRGIILFWAIRRFV